MRRLGYGGTSRGVLLLALLVSGCGGPAGGPGTGSPDEGATASPRAGGSGGSRLVPPSRPSTAPGADGKVARDESFDARRLTDALPPATAFGDGAKVIEAGAVDFAEHGGGDWGPCGAGAAPRAEMRGLTGTTVRQTARAGDQGADADPMVLTLVSMPAGKAARYLAVRRRLHASCPVVTVDTDAAPEEEHHLLRRLARLGDEAQVETVWRTGTDTADTTHVPTVLVRVGGVLVLAEGGPDEDRGIALAARSARRVAERLYRPDGT